MGAERGRGGDAGGPGVPGPRAEHAFAHASEAEFARILDFYQVAWEYEAHVFPILWDLDGNVLESFAPDFFLPELEVYVELTTLQQRLVRKKNRKVRRLRELFPGIRIKLFYARDFRALMLKYGRAALLSELSGSLGQVPALADVDQAPAGADRTGTGNEARDLESPPAAGEPRPRHGRRSRAARRRAGSAAAATAIHSPIA
jgi:hypothetical protein